ncbi:MAG: cadmium-translocating P-type ATPase [Candidatus Methanomethylophilaceae archaeon]|nr:cadmium-translocating P-type ATPase [Candidatus Methanomethylophilaceae archaeon]
MKGALNKEVSAETLVVTALIGCLLLGEYIAAAEVAIIMSFGELLETLVTSHARTGMDALSRLKADRASVVVGDSVVETALEDVKVGSVIRVFPGDMIPLDGTVVGGSSSVDRSAVTGESVPADVVAGDEVLAGTGNLYGSIDVRVDRAGEDSFVARMAALLDSADAGKSRMVRTADRWARYILLGAAAITVATFVLTGDVHRALTVMVVFCPCAFVLATPTGIMAAAGNMARNGVLLRDASAVERMSKVRTVLFDKTGTLTEGRMACTGFTGTADGMDPERVGRLVASLESRSDHPLGKAVAAAYEPAGDVQDFRNVPGQGVTGVVDGVRVAAGNRRLMESVCPEGLEAAVEASQDLPLTTVLVGIDGRTVGFMSLEDRVKDASAGAVAELRAEGVSAVMLTGDSGTVGGSVARKLGMSDVVWECTPETKLRTVEYFESKGPTCMIGDGMNDAPALKRSAVGVSMGSMGNDMAVGSSDIVFVHDDIGKVPGMLRLCRRAVLTIAAGLALSMAINVAGTALAVTGEIDPAMGAIIHNGGSFAVVLLAASLLWSNEWAPKARAKNNYPVS